MLHPVVASYHYGPTQSKSLFAHKLTEGRLFFDVMRKGLIQSASKCRGIYHLRQVNNDEQSARCLPLRQGGHELGVVAYEARVDQLLL